MSNVQLDVQLSCDDLLKIIHQFSAPELEQFVTQVIALQAKRRAPNFSQSEAELIDKIHTLISPELQATYTTLIEKRQTERLSSDEYQNLVQLTHSIERLEVTRLEYWVEFARIRQTSSAKFPNDKHTIMAKNMVTPYQKEEVLRRSHDACEYCQSQLKFSVQPFSVEHIIPCGHNNRTVLGNLVLACQGCSTYKYSKIEGFDKISKKTVALYNPRRDEWYEHFAWNDDFTEVIGLTPQARATIETLQLNREGLVSSRRILYSVGEHPPNVLKQEGSPGAGYSNN